MIGGIPFTVPSEFAAGYSSGSIERFGALLKDASTGKIVGHLQESGMGADLLGNLVGDAVNFTDPVSALSSLGANYQLHEVKQMMEGLQMLGFANLAVSVVGIGVSVAGFAVMNRRFDLLSDQISRLEKTIRRQFENLEWQFYRSHFSNLKGLMEHGRDLGYTEAGKEPWLELAGKLSQESAFFKDQLAHLLAQEGFDARLFTELAVAYGNANAARVQSFLMSGDLDAAHKVAEALAADSSRLFDEITPVELARKILLSRSDSRTPSAPERMLVRRKMEKLVHGFREAQDIALSRPYLIQSLAEQGVSGPAYIRTLREEKEHPLLVLPVR